MDTVADSIPLATIKNQSKSSLGHKDIFIKPGFMSDKYCGTAYIEHCGIKIAASVYGPHHRAWQKNASNFVSGTHFKLQDVEQVDNNSQLSICRFNVESYIAPFSAIGGGYIDQDKDFNIRLTNFVQKSLEPSILLHKYPKASIDLYITVIQQQSECNSNLYTSQMACQSLAVICGSMALIDAGVQVYDQVVSVSAVSRQSNFTIDPYACDNVNLLGNQLIMSFMPSLQKVTNINLNCNLQDSSSLKNLIDSCKERLYEIEVLAQQALQSQSKKLLKNNKRKEID